MLELTEESTNLAGFDSISKIRKQTKKVSKRNIALPHRAVGNEKNSPA